MGLSRVERAALRAISESAWRPADATIAVLCRQPGIDEESARRAVHTLEDSLLVERSGPPDPMLRLTPDGVAARDRGMVTADPTGAIAALLAIAAEGPTNLIDLLDRVTTPVGPDFRTAARAAKEAEEAGMIRRPEGGSLLDLEIAPAGRQWLAGWAAGRAVTTRAEETPGVTVATFRQAGSAYLIRSGR